MNSSAASYSAAGGSQSYANSSALDSSMNSGVNQSTSFSGNPNETSIDDEDADDMDEDEDGIEEDDDDGSECSKPLAKKKSEKAKWTATEVRIFECGFFTRSVRTMLNLHVRFIHPL